MPDSQSSEPGFESRFVTVSKIGHFLSLHWRPCSLSCINEYLAIDNGGNVSDLALVRNCCLARMLPGEAELVSEWTVLPGRAKSVKRFERSNGLDTTLYKKNYLYLFTRGPNGKQQLKDGSVLTELEQHTRGNSVSDSVRHHSITRTVILPSWFIMV